MELVSKFGVGQRVRDVTDNFLGTVLKVITSEDYDDGVYNLKEWDEKCPTWRDNHVYFVLYDVGHPTVSKDKFEKCKSDKSIYSQYEWLPLHRVLATYESVLEAVVD